VPDFLVTGTDTGVGKTVIAAALVRALRDRGLRAIGFKPVETGVDGVAPADSELLQRASLDDIALARPLLRLAEPLAPAVAAERAGVPVRAEDIEHRLAQLRREGYTVVVEGAGGLLVPLTWETGAVPLIPVQSPEPRAQSPFYTVLDLAERFGLEAIIVGRAGLGTLNHVALAVAALRARGISIAAVVLNGGQPWPPSDLAEATNPGALARMLPGVRIVCVPHHQSVNAAGAIEGSVPYLSGLSLDLIAY
jgi:dethiobiotin synthetase